MRTERSSVFTPEDVLLCRENCGEPNVSVWLAGARVRVFVVVLLDGRHEVDHVLSVRAPAAPARRVDRARGVHRVGIAMEIDQDLLVPEAGSAQGLVGRVQTLLQRNVVPDARRVVTGRA